MLIDQITIKKINQYDENEKFIKLYDSVADASRETGIPEYAISKVCNGVYKFT